MQIYLLSEALYEYYHLLFSINVRFNSHLHLLSETLLTVRRIPRDIVIIHTDLHVKYPLFLSDFNEI